MAAHPAEVYSSIHLQLEETQSEIRQSYWGFEICGVLSCFSAFGRERQSFKTLRINVRTTSRSFGDCHASIHMATVPRLKEPMTFAISKIISGVRFAMTASASLTLAPLLLLRV